MRHGATDAEIQRVVAVIEELGYKASRMPGAQRTAVGLVGNDGRVDASRLEALPGVQEIIHVSKPYKQVSREWKSERSEEHTSELQSQSNLVCRLLLEKKKIFC